LEGERGNLSARRGVVITVNATVGIEAGDVAASGAADVGEGSTDDAVTIRLAGNRAD